MEWAIRGRWSETTLVTKSDSRQAAVLRTAKEGMRGPGRSSRALSRSQAAISQRQAGSDRHVHVEILVAPGVSERNLLTGASRTIDIDIRAQAITVDPSRQIAYVVDPDRGAVQGVSLK